MHTYHTSIQFMGSIKRTFAHQGICHRSLKLIRKCPYLFCRIGKDRAAAYHDKWFLGFSDHQKRPFQVFLGNRIYLTSDGHWLFCFILTACRCHILGDIYQHRTWAAAFGDLKGSS